MKRLFIALQVIMFQFSIGQQGIYIDSGGHLNNDNGSITIVNGNFINESNIALNGGTLKMKGLNNNVYDIDISNQNTFDYLELYGSSTFNLSGQLTLNDELEFFNTSNFHLNSGSYLELSPDATITGESNTNTITGDDNTYIITTRNHTAGELNSFGNIGLEVFNGNESMGSTEVIRKYGDLYIDGNIAVRRYYEINPTNNSNLGLDVNFYILDTDLNSLDRTNLAAFRSTDSANTFTNEGGIPESSYHFVPSIDAFSLWAFSNSSVLNLEDIENNIDSIEMYPNPSKNLVNIRNTEGIDIISLELINFLGQKFPVELSSENSFSVNNLSEGLYILKIHTSKGDTSKKLIVK